MKARILPLLSQPRDTCEGIGDSMLELIGKLNNLFRNILGGEFEFQAIDEIRSVDLWAAADLKLLVGPQDERPRYIESIRSGQLGFPIDNNGKCLGIAVVRGKKGKSPEQLLLLADLFAFILKSHLENESKKQDLKVWEDKLRIVMSSDKNVIQLRRPSSSTHQATKSGAASGIRSGIDMSLSNITSDDRAALEFRSQAAGSENSTSPLLTKPILIESSETFPLSRLVVELHQLSGRWALVSRQDLPADIFASKEKLKELGAVTLFIPNIADLSIPEQLKLAEYLSQAPDSESPQVIAGANESVESLEMSQKVLSHLLHLFYHSNLRWADENETPVSTLDERAEATTEVVQTSLRYMDDEIKRLHRVRDHLIPFHHQYFDPDHTTLH